MSRVEELSKAILNELLGDFINRNLSARQLEDSYVGVRLTELRKGLCGDDNSDSVDFELALKGLERNEWISSGPMEPYKNTPDSGVFVVGIFSKREYVYLTEEGYRETKRLKTSKSQRSVSPRVHISGGNFHHSPIGIGADFTQSISINNSGVFADLRNAVLSSTLAEGDRVKLVTSIDAMESAKSTPTFLDRYKEFIGLAADHMTLLAPYLPALTAWLCN